MSSPLPLEISVGRMPLNYSDTWQHTFQDMVSRMRATVKTDGGANLGDTVIIGSNSTQSPTSDKGPHWNSSGGRTWFTWNLATGRYTPPITKIASGEFGVTLHFLGTQVTTQTATFSDASGTVALLGDVYVPRETILLTGTSMTVDWGTTSAANSDFFGLLTGNTTIAFSNAADARIIDITLENLGTAYTVTWTPTILWAGGSHTMPTGDKAVARFRIYDINSVFYGIMTTFTPSSAEPMVDLGGNPPGNYGNSGNDPVQKPLKNLY